MKSKILVFLLIAGVFIMTASAGCSRQPAVDDRVLVHVSDNSITVDDFKSRINRMPSYYRSIVEKNKKRYLEEMIVEKLFYEEAVRQGLNRDKEVVALINDAKRKIIMAKLIEDEVDNKVDVSDEEVTKYYEENKADFKTPEMWRASHILLATDKDARDVLLALANGEKFEDLAKERSMDATASRGGDIGYFRRGQLVPEFENECIKLNVGQISDVVKTQFGYHIVKLTDKKEAGIEDLDNVKKQITSVLKRKRRAELFDKLVRDLKDKYGVEIEEEVFLSIEDQETPKSSS